MLIDTHISRSRLFELFSVHSIPKLVPAKPPVAICRRGKVCKRLLKAASHPKLLSANQLDRAYLLSFSCAHARIVDKMSAVTMLQQERQKQPSLSLCCELLQVA